MVVGTIADTGSDFASGFVRRKGTEMNNDVAGAASDRNALDAERYDAPDSADQLAQVLGVSQAATILTGLDAAGEGTDLSGRQAVAPAIRPAGALSAVDAGVEFADMPYVANLNSIDEFPAPSTNMTSFANTGPVGVTAAPQAGPSKMADAGRTEVQPQSAGASAPAAAPDAASVAKPSANQPDDLSPRGDTSSEPVPGQVARPDIAADSPSTISPVLTPASDSRDQVSQPSDRPATSDEELSPPLGEDAGVAPVPAGETEPISSETDQEPSQPDNTPENVEDDVDMSDATGGDAAAGDTDVTLDAGPLDAAVPLDPVEALLGDIDLDVDLGDDAADPVATVVAEADPLAEVVDLADAEIADLADLDPLADGGLDLLAPDLGGDAAAGDTDVTLDAGPLDAAVPLDPVEALLGDIDLDVDLGENMTQIADLADATSTESLALEDVSSSFDAMFDLTSAFDLLGPGPDDGSFITMDLSGGGADLVSSLSTSGGFGVETGFASDSTSTGDIATGLGSLSTVGGSLASATTGSVTQSAGSLFGWY